MQSNFRFSTFGRRHGSLSLVLFALLLSSSCSPLAFATNDSSPSPDHPLIKVGGSGPVVINSTGTPIVSRDQNPQDQIPASQGSIQSINQQMQSVVKTADALPLKDVLPGRNWNGTFHVQITANWRNGCAVQTDAYDLDLHINVPRDEIVDGKNYVAHITGTAHLANPSISTKQCDRVFTGSVTYRRSDYQIHTGLAKVDTEGSFLRVDGFFPNRPDNDKPADVIMHVPGRGDFRMGKDDPLAILAGIPQRIPIQVVDAHHFTTNGSFDTGVNTSTHFVDDTRMLPIRGVLIVMQKDNDDEYEVTVAMKGSFSDLSGAAGGRAPGPGGKAGKALPGRWLAALLAYFLLLLAGIMTDPAASKFVAGFAGLVGLTEALGGLGLATLAEQGRLGGFVGAALAEAVELVRIYQTSTEDGESWSTTAARLGISLGADFAGFMASAATMEAAVGVVAAVTGIVGTAGAIIVGVGGAAVLTYGVAAGGDAMKSWANTLLNQAIGK